MSKIILNIIGTFVKILLINNYELKNMVLNLKSNSIRKIYYLDKAPFGEEGII